MRTIDRRVANLENRSGNRKDWPEIHILGGYTFDLDEDQDLITKEYAEVHGIDLDDGQRHVFVIGIRPQHETDKRIAEGREREEPEWRKGNALILGSNTREKTEYDQ